MWSSLAFACFLVALSVVLTLQHIRAWRTADAAEVDPRQVEYARRQYRRRMQASVMIGLIGAAVGGGIWISNPVTTLLYWSGVFFAAVWVALLALLDFLSIRVHYGALQSGQREAYDALREELNRLRARAQNGHGSHRDALGERSAADSDDARADDRKL